MSELETTLYWQMKAVGLQPQTEYRFAPPRRFRADFAFPDQKLLVEVEGGSYVSGRHTRGLGFEKDCEKYNLAALGGWHVIRVTGAQVRSGLALMWIEQALGADINKVVGTPPSPRPRNGI